MRTLFFSQLSLCLASLAVGEDIARPADAPKPLSPAESAACVKLPDGFRLELLAAEPLVKEPSGVCWDERGRLFVCELHGYNLEGQFDIEELNKTGELDRAVRRIQANPRAKKAAEEETYGTVKLLLDTDGDGRMNKAHVWADRLPPCYGLCSARGGVIVACAPDIIYLADRDGDGKAEVRETLYTGFDCGILERRINNPQWGLDDWIYVGRGGGGTISGPHLAKPVELPRTDFRIKADGSAIEPVSGGTQTFGIAISEIGERFVISTRTPAIYIAPLRWHYLARNPHLTVSKIDIDVSTGQRVFPISQPHPWRTKRAEDPDFAKFYTDHYGKEESSPNGFFTSACSPLIYQDSALPGLRGHLLACEPAQNLLHRAVVDHRDIVPKLHRPEAETEREFLASSDTWFHPIALTHAPDGSVAIVDFYREIIEDYSAIPRYLQQQYGLVNGQEHGRLWRLTHRDAEAAPAADMSRLTPEQLAKEIGSGHFWRRQTAQRLISERSLKRAAPELRRILREHEATSAVLTALYTLQAIDELEKEDVSAALASNDSGVRLHALRLSEPWLDERDGLLDKAIALADDEDPKVRLQLAMTLGASRSKRVPAALANLAKENGDLRWMPEAIISSFNGRGAAILAELMNQEGESVSNTKAGHLLQPLCKTIAAARDEAELATTLIIVADATDRGAQTACLRGLAESFANPVRVALSEEGHAALARIANHEQADMRQLGRSLVVGMKAEEAAQRKARLRRAARDLSDIQQPLSRRLAAVEELAAEDDYFDSLIAAFADNTPRVRQAILSSLMAKRQRLPAVVEALERKRLPVSALSAVQKSMLLDHPDEAMRTRAAQLFAAAEEVSDEVFAQFEAALSNPRDVSHGEEVFRKNCSICHQAHGVGYVVGPDLTAEINRSEETIVKDVLAPSAEIAANYATYVIETTEGRVHNGLLASESPSGVTLHQQEGKQVTVLRKDIEALRAVNVSMMPADLAKTLKPQDLADAIAWLRTPPARRILFDDDPEFVSVLTNGGGVAAMDGDDFFAGFASLRIKPLQRHSPTIEGWQFRIREKPAKGEYRYLRFAWKSGGAHGVMIELANSGNWPPAGEAKFRYVSGRNTSGWKAVEIDESAPAEWTVVTRDLWKDFGDCTITGIAPTAMGGDALFDRIELLQINVASPGP